VNQAIGSTLAAGHHTPDLGSAAPVVGCRRLTDLIAAAVAA
jgi:hypothetical protein